MKIKLNNHNYEVTLVEYNESKGMNIYTDDVENTGIYNQSVQRPNIQSAGMKFILKQIERNGYHNNNDKIVPHPDNFDDIKNISWKILDGNRLDCYIEVTDKYDVTHSYNVLRY